jgi:hypothetical protein
VEAADESEDKCGPEFYCIHQVLAIVSNAEQSGGGPPQSKTLARIPSSPNLAKRLGLRQPPGALPRTKSARVKA